MFTQYLKSLEKQKARYLKGEEMQLVMGNEAMDVDSFASSFIYAYLLSLSYPNTLPLLNFSRSQLNKRRDLLYLLKALFVKTEALLCKEEITGLKALHLVDHNQLSFQDQNLKMLSIALWTTTPVQPPISLL